MGDVEEVEDLVLEGGELGVEGLDDVSVLVEEVVARKRGEDVEDAGGGGGGAAAVLGVDRQLREVVGGHGVADVAFDEGLGEHGDEVGAAQSLDAGGVV